MLILKQVVFVAMCITEFLQLGKSRQITNSPRSFWNAFFPCVECREGRSGKPFCLPFGFLYVPPCCVDHQEIHESESTTTSPTTITPTTTKITSTTTYSATTSLTMETTTTSQITPTLSAEKDPSKLYNTKGCGLSRRRIIGGEEAKPSEFPWMCSILFNDNTFYGCGATLISCDPLIILSAAHCFWGLSDFTISRLKVGCGDHVSFVNFLHD